MDKFISSERILITGEGKPVVLVHGMGGPRIWDSFIGPLSRYYKVIVPTFPGFIEKDGIIHYSDDLYVQFLEKMRDAFGFTDLILIGCSMGGRTVLNYSLHYMKNVSSIIIIDSAGLNNFSPLFYFPIIHNIMPAMISKMLSNQSKIKDFTLADFVHQDSATAHETFEWFSSMIKPDSVRINFANILKAIGVENKSWEYRLSEIIKPTLILWSSDDNTCPVKYAYKFNSLISNSELAVLSGYKHMGILEEPQFFMDKIMDFLKRYQL